MQEVSYTDTASVEPFSIIKSPEINQLALAQIKNAGISEEAVEDYYPSTAEQDRMFRMTIQDPTGRYFILRLYFKLSPEIKLETFRQAWSYVVDALPIFRTRLLSLGDSTSLQVVMKETIEWHEFNGGVGNAKLLTVGWGNPLTSWSITGSTVDGDDKFFVFYAHHALLDGWSMASVGKAFAYAYKHAKAPYVPASFNALIKYYESLDQETADNFWRSELANAHASTFSTMPSESYKPYQTNVIETEVILPKLLNSNISMATIIQVSFALTLSKYEKSRDIVFRTTGAGRYQPVPYLRETIGAVLTSFPFRIQLEPAETLQDLLERVQIHKMEVSKYEYRGVEHIKSLADNSNGIVCDSNIPYILVQPETFGPAPDGMERLKNKWQPGLIPFAVFCTLNPDGMTVEIGFDSHTIEEPMVTDGFAPKFEEIVRAVLGYLNTENGGDSVRVEALLNLAASEGGNFLRLN